MSSPSRRTSPASLAPGTDSCIRFKMRRNVDLPHPEGPIRAVTDAGGTDSETSSRTWVSPNQAETSTASSRAASGWAPGPADDVRGAGTSITMSSTATVSYAPAIPTIGLFSGVPPSEPRKPASPKLKMPPSLATSQ